MKILILLLYLFIMIDASAQSNSVCNNNKIFAKTDVSPVLVSSINQLEKELNENIKMRSRAKNVFNNIYFEGVINCKGSATNFKLVSLQPNAEQLKTFKSIINQIIEVIENNSTWTPASQKGSDVDHRVILMITYENSTFKIRPPIFG